MPKVFPISILFTGVVLLVSHELSIPADITFPPVVFWVAVVLIIGSLVFQIFRFAGSFAGVIIAEILAANFAFHLIYLLPYPGLYGGGIQVDWWVLNHFLERGSFSLASTPFPGFQLLNGAISLVTGIGTYDVVKFFPSVLDTSLILTLYLFLKKTLDSAREALLAVLLLVTLFFHVWFYSTYHWQVQGTTLVVLALYLYFSAGKSHYGTARKGLAIMCLPALLISHHLSGLYILLFLIIYWVTSRILRLFYKGRQYPPVLSFVAIAAAMTLAYWSLVYVAALRDIIVFLQSLFLNGGFAEGVYADSVLAPNVTLREYMQQYGFYLFHLVFGAVIVYSLVFTRRREDVWFSSFSLFLFFWGAVGLLTMFVLPRSYAKLDSDRALVLGWLFGFAPLVAGTLALRPKWLYRMGVGTLVAFMFFGLFMVSPIQWDPAAEQPNATATSEDLALAETFGFSGKIGLFSGQTTLMAIYGTHPNYNRITRPATHQEYLVVLGTASYAAIGRPVYPTLDWIIMKRQYILREIALTSGGTARKPNEAAKELSDNMMSLWADGYDSFGRRNLVYSSTNLVVFR